MADTYHDQLLKDSEFLCTDKRLDLELMDKLVLQLNRIYPPVLSDKEAQKFRNVRVPTCRRLSELLVHLQGKGEEACQEFYRALQIHAEEVFISLPTRVSRRETTDPKGNNTATGLRERFILNDRGSWFYLSCFGIMVGVALLYYCDESRELDNNTRRVLGFTALGVGTWAREVLVSYAEDGSRSQ